MELAQDLVQWRDLVLAMLKLLSLLPERYFVRKLDLSDTGCEVGRWMELAQYRV